MKRGKSCICCLYRHLANIWSYPKRVLTFFPPTILVFEALKSQVKLTLTMKACLGSEWTETPNNWTKEGGTEYRMERILDILHPWTGHIRAQTKLLD